MCKTLISIINKKRFVQSQSPSSKCLMARTKGELTINASFTHTLARLVSSGDDPRLKLFPDYRCEDDYPVLSLLRDTTKNKSRSVGKGSELLDFVPAAVRGWLHRTWFGDKKVKTELITGETARCCNGGWQNKDEAVRPRMTEEDED